MSQSHVLGIIWSLLGKLRLFVANEHTPNVPCLLFLIIPVTTFRCANTLRKNELWKAILDRCADKDCDKLIESLATHLNVE